MENTIKELVESKEFYDLMQSYRIAPMANQDNVIDRYDKVKDFLTRESSVRMNEIEAKVCDLICTEISVETYGSVRDVFKTKQ